MREIIIVIAVLFLVSGAFGQPFIRDSLHAAQQGVAFVKPAFLGIDKCGNQYLGAAKGDSLEANERLFKMHFFQRDYKLTYWWKYTYQDTNRLWWEYYIIYADSDTAVCDTAMLDVFGAQIPDSIPQGGSARIVVQRPIYMLGSMVKIYDLAVMEDFSRRLDMVTPWLPVSSLKLYEGPPFYADTVKSTIVGE